MTDLNVMLREHARTGLQAQLDAAVTNGDTEAARKVTAELEKLAVTTAPQAPPYGQEEIRAALEAKAPWFGVDPRKSGKAVQLGKDMNLKKFATAEAFAEALIKAVDEEFKPAVVVKDPPENETDEERETREAQEAEEAEAATKAKKTRASDAPNDGDTAGQRSRRASGPWLKLSDAPADVQKEIQRTADKFAPKTKEGRENYVARALKAQYDAAQRNKGKK